MPAYRALGEGPGGNRYYLDSVSGLLIAKFDADGQAYRWLHQAPHLWDFSPTVRAHPLWFVDVDTAQRCHGDLWTGDLSWYTQTQALRVEPAQTITNAYLAATFQNGQLETESGRLSLTTSRRQHALSTDRLKANRVGELTSTVQSS